MKQHYFFISLLLLFLSAGVSAKPGRIFTVANIDSVNSYCSTLIRSKKTAEYNNVLNSLNSTVTYASQISYTTGIIEANKLIAKIYQAQGNVKMFKKTKLILEKYHVSIDDELPKEVTSNKEAEKALIEAKNKEIEKQKEIISSQQSTLGEKTSSLQQKLKELEQQKKSLELLKVEKSEISSALNEQDKVISLKEAQIMQQEAEQKTTEEQIKFLEQAKKMTDYKAEQAQKKQQFLFVGLFIMLFFSIILGYFIYRSVKANTKLKTAMIQLKATQKQLVEKEKLASLGLLTAGIAHEIKNPLNFINNFSESSIELIDELASETSESERAELIGFIKDNTEKVLQHGKRADSIVNGMLEHSRESSKESELTSLNPLLEEALNFSLAGFKSGNSSTSDIIVVKKFDASIKPMQLMKQDLNRVFLNILNNAIYSVIKKKEMNLEAAYKAKIEISSTVEKQYCIITIRDNGLGMSRETKDKLLLPFYTTKPAGEGTGLGLSISYDIIVNEHQGELLVESEEGAYAEFVIKLPIQADII